MYRAMLWIDPGLRSGWASWEQRSGGNVFACGIADPIDLMEICERWTNGHAGQAALVGSESFEIRPDTHIKDQAAMQWPMELRGVLRYLAWRNDIAFDTQSPADMKSFAGERHRKLKFYGWHTPGPEDHARDATGHLLVALIGRGIRP